MEGKETTLKELGEMLAHVVKHMATKDELKEFREETVENFRAIRAEVAAMSWGKRPAIIGERLFVGR